MKNYKYYTPTKLAEILIELLPKNEYGSAIDICCGSWNLLKAVNKRYPNARLIGIDIDEEAGKCQISNSTFFCQDGRDYSISTNKKFDLIVSNPPFGRLNKKDRKFSELKTLSSINSSRYENEMLLANFMLSNNNGTLLFILPSTFLEGESYLEVRKHIANEYKIEAIVRLPDNTFGSGKIHTYAIIITNTNCKNDDAKLMEVINDDDNWTINQIKEIPSHQLVNGEWIIRHYGKGSKDIIAFRGIISSADFGDRGKKVFHNSSSIINGQWCPSIRYCDKEGLLAKSRKADVGDIIINRIGRCAGYWTTCNEEAFVSDCIIVIKKNDKLDINKKLSENSVDGKLSVNVYGLTTKYITIKNILSLS